MLLCEVGWEFKDGVFCYEKIGMFFVFEFMIMECSEEKIVFIFVWVLKEIGIEMFVCLVDVV